MEHSKISELVAQIYELMGEKLRVGGASLNARVRKAGRALPKSVRRAALELIEAQSMAENPNLMTRLDAPSIMRAHRKCLDYLTDVDPAAERSRARYNMAALVSAQLLILVTLAIIFARWRGLI